MSKNFQPLSSGEVLSVSNESQIVIGHSTFRVSEFTAALKKLMLENSVGGVTSETIDWLNAEGIDCDVLRFGSDGWVKGKVRLHLEFAEDADSEASPDPKIEAAIESFAPVAAAVSSTSEPVLDEFDDVDLGLADDDFSFPEATTPAPITSDTLVDPQETFVQEDDASFDDLFVEEELSETVEETDDSGFDDLFADESLEEETQDIAIPAPDSTPESLDDDDFDLDIDDGFDDLLADSESESNPSVIADADGDTELETASAVVDEDDNLDELFDDDSLFGDESNDGAAGEAEQDAGLTDLESLGDDSSGDELDFDLGDADGEPSAELEAIADDDGDDLFGDAEDLFAETKLSPDMGETEDDADDLDDLLLEDTGDDLGLDDLDEPASALGDDADSTSDAAVDDDLELDNLFDEDTSEFDEDTSESESDLFDNPFDEAIAAEESETTNDSSTDDLIDFDSAEDTEITTADKKEEPSDEMAADFDLGGDEEEFSFEAFDEQDEPDLDAPVDDEVADLLFESEEEDEEDDLTADELPPEIDFGSTEDLGEFIDVSIMKKKMSPSAAPPTAPAAESTDEEVESPFELGDDSNVFDNDDDDDISLGELFENDDDSDGDFDFAALDDGDDPLDAVTGEEEEVSADIWDLE
ncbi:KGK domain-containing protein [[Leptolyngbya] sp. PCC 7376]|uniref:KGK domain-containing protein n=1 Tax=[Leptolyngbya] sp. PCC 7376 TaxID=111781 RepID=UPI001356E89F|nr:KGK domain-containing protein [[Leptolyngbya] sp. PCC 7376]